MKMFARALALTLVPATAWAGMPRLVWTEPGLLRWQTLSLYLVVVLATSIPLRMALLALADELPRLPRPSHGQAVLLTLGLALGIFFALELVAGGRQVLTPAAWSRVGLTYELAAPEGEPWQARPARVERLRQLHASLVAAAARDGAWPAHELDPAVPAERWTSLAPTGEPFVYLGPGDGPTAIVAYEPGIYGSSRFVLQADGEIRELPYDPFEGFEGR